MIRWSLSVTLMTVSMFALLTSTGSAAQGVEPGTAYCFGVSCPCGNDDPNAGCINSTGQGALMTSSGSASVSADDLAFSGTSLPPTSVTLLIAGTTTTSVPFKDGKLCVSGDTYRLWKHYNSGRSGTVDVVGVVGLFGADAIPLDIQSGETWNFQMWVRDSPANQTPCGGKANFTNAYSVTFTP